MMGLGAARTPARSNATRGALGSMMALPKKRMSSSWEVMARSSGCWSRSGVATRVGEAEWTGEVSPGEVCGVSDFLIFFEMGAGVR